MAMPATAASSRCRQSRDVDGAVVVRHRPPCRAARVVGRQVASAELADTLWSGLTPGPSWYRAVVSLCLSPSWHRAVVSLCLSLSLFWREGCPIATDGDPRGLVDIFF